MGQALRRRGGSSPRWLEAGAALGQALRRWEQACRWERGRTSRGGRAEGGYSPGPGRTHGASAEEGLRRPASGGKL